MFEMEQGFCETLRNDPDDLATWMALHDWLLDNNDPRVDFVKQQLQGRGCDMGENHEELDQRVQTLLETGHRPCVPMWTNSIGMKLVHVKAGKFQMGSPVTEEDRENDEQQHDVTLTKDYWIGVYQVTEENYKNIMGHNPHWLHPESNNLKIDTSNFPIQNINWQDAQNFCKRLSNTISERKSMIKYRLPTEAEWEYACRGGHLTKTYQMFYFGDSISSTHANFGPYSKWIRQVGERVPNALGLYDMYGNVWEFCSDYYGADYYETNAAACDPTGPSKGSQRVIRGGGWFTIRKYCRSAYRGKFDPKTRYHTRGFRVVAEKLQS